VAGAIGLSCRRGAANDLGVLPLDSVIAAVAVLVDSPFEYRNRVEGSADPSSGRRHGVVWR
jgi:hypothetical protein